MTQSEKTINSILVDLNNVRENLFTLSQDIWDSIDHNDQEKLDEGYAFKKEFNKLLQEFENNATQISVLISQFTGVSAQTNSIEEKSEDENERMIKELNKNEPHTINEDFTYKRPFAFVIQNKAFTEQNSWSALYIFVKFIYKNFSEKLIKIADNQNYISKQDRKYYSKNPSDLRKPEKIAEDFFVETNLSANDFAKRIKEILKFVNIKENLFTLYLRQDRNA